MISPSTHYIVLKKTAAWKLNDLLPKRVTVDQLTSRVIAAIKDQATTWRHVSCYTGVGISAGVTLYGVPMVLFFAVPVDENGRPRTGPDGRKWLAFLTGAVWRIEDATR
jgi:hypothetical protein